MGSALFAILMFARVPLFVYVTSAITDHIKDVVLYVVDQVFQMLITVDSARVWKKIERRTKTWSVYEASAVDLNHVAK
uniref:Hypotheticial protein n=1 Tax=Schistosoma japonicum TaxID=6182 RepID=C1LHP3_SCHJA|nr:hypotheticial protein [Schistosoma japonicum]